MPLYFINRNKFKKQRGAAAIEFGLILPLLLLIVDGAIEFGAILHDQSVISSASSLAARAGIAPSTNKLSTAQISAIASQYCSVGLISFMPTDPPVIIVSQSIDPTYKTPLRVTVNYKFQGLLVGGFIAALSKNLQLSASTVMYNE